MGHHTAAVLNCDLALFVLKEDPALIQLLDFAVNFPSWLISRMTFRWSVLRMICGSRLLPQVLQTVFVHYARHGGTEHGDVG
jgi:hypothetical protein